MFELYASGTYSISMLTEELNNFQKLHPEIRTPCRAYVHHLLLNPFYIGEFYYSKTLFKGHPDYHPRLIEYDLWKKVQDVLEGRGTFRKRWSDEKFPFVGLMRCGGSILDFDGKPTDQKCGYAITGEVKRRLTQNNGYNYHYYYHCANNRSVTGCTHRNIPYLKAKGLKRYVRQEEIENRLSTIFTPFEYSDSEATQMIAEYQKYEDGLMANQKRELVKLEAMKTEVQRLISKSYEDKINGVIPENIWIEKYRKWMDDESKIKAQIKAFDKMEVATTPLLKECIEQTKNLSSLYHSVDFPGAGLRKRKLVEIVASNVILNDSSIGFNWRKPWNLLPKKGEIEKWSEREDSNLRPSAPKADALPNCATLRHRINQKR